MMTRSMLILCALILLLPGFSFAQISEGGTPPSFTTNVKSSIASISLRPVDNSLLLAQDEAELSKDEPLPFGFPHEVAYDMTNAGIWERLPDGGRLWRLRVECPEAYSINLVYRKFWLPPGAQFFVYNEDRSMVIGAFTARNNKEYGTFATQPVRGDVSILEYYEPPDAAAPGVIAIERVVHAYRNLFDWEVAKDLLDFGSSGACNNNVNCPVGDEWQDDKRAVAMILTSGGWRLCTGALVNNVREDLTPYFLTANHCLGGEESWIFMFNYESPTCSNVDGPTWMTLQGSILRANYYNSDFALLELVEDPPDSYSVYYAGWSAIDEPAQSTVGIHHPSGDIKKISFDYDPVVSTNYAAGSNGSHWRVAQWDDGTTEPGSSGSPLFDSLTHRIIGQLHGGTASCASLTSDYYGKFAKSWDVGATAATRLKDWLDPDNTGMLALDGLDPQGASFTGTPQHGFTPLDVQFTGTSFLPVDSWEWDFGDGGSASVQAPLHAYTTPGIYDVRLDVTAGVDSASRVRQDYIIALADTVRTADTVVEQAGRFSITLYGTNVVPVYLMTLPVLYDGTLDLVLDSFSTTGCRTDYFEVASAVHVDANRAKVTVRLQAESGSTGSELAAGSGPILKLYFNAPTALPGDTAWIDLDGYDIFNLQFVGSLLQYEPAAVSAGITYPVCCEGIRGDATNDDRVNVVDLTSMVDYLFKGGDEPACYDEADCDGNGLVNVSDITFLVDFLFKEGPDPVSCP